MQELEERIVSVGELALLAYFYERNERELVELRRQNEWLRNERLTVTKVATAAA